MEADKIDALPGQPAEGVNFNKGECALLGGPQQELASHIQTHQPIINDFFITGEDYAGHYVPQLASTILSQNIVTNQTKINLKGIAIGNAWIDDVTQNLGWYDYLRTHAMNSNETNAGIHKYCNFTGKHVVLSDNEYGDIDQYNIYAPFCNKSSPAPSTGSVNDFDPCSDNYVQTYLNLKEVQAALHVKPTVWRACSGDRDLLVSVTATPYAINTLNLTTETAWRPWYSGEEVGGYVVGYKGLTFATVRGASHEVPSYQPERALTLFSSFLQGTLPPPGS
ncbi:hypothetical protein ACLB2K_009766 [Fragaria x ananassa]